MIFVSRSNENYNLEPLITMTQSLFSFSDVCVFLKISSANQTKFTETEMKYKEILHLFNQRAVIHFECGMLEIFVFFLKCSAQGMLLFLMVC